MGATFNKKLFPLIHLWNTVFSWKYCLPEIWFQHLIILNLSSKFHVTHLPNLFKSCAFTNYFFNIHQEENITKFDHNSWYLAWNFSLRIKKWWTWFQIIEGKWSNCFTMRVQIPLFGTHPTIIKSQNIFTLTIYDYRVTNNPLIITKNCLKEENVSIKESNWVQRGFLLNLTVSKLKALIRSAGEKSKETGIYGHSQEFFDQVLLDWRKSGPLEIFRGFLKR